MIEQPQKAEDVQREDRGQREGERAARGERGQQRGEHAQGRGEEHPQTRTPPCTTDRLSPNYGSGTTTVERQSNCFN